MSCGMPTLLEAEPGRITLLVTVLVSSAVKPVLRVPLRSLTRNCGWPNALYGLTSTVGSTGMPFWSSIRPENSQPRVARLAVTVLGISEEMLLTSDLSLSQTSA